MLPFLAMLPLLFVDPFAHNPKVFEVTVKSSQTPYSETDKLEFKKELQIHSWDLWIQEGPQDLSFCIHCIDTEDPSHFIDSFKKALFEKNSYALFLNNLLTKHLSSNHSLINASYTVERVLDLMIDPDFIGSSYDFFYVLPLLPSQLENHREYCRLAMNEKKESTIAACKAFKMIWMKKWIQDGKYVIYYQKMTHSPKEARETFLSLRDHPKALLATKTLREQTGLEFQDLCPTVRCISLFSK